MSSNYSHWSEFLDKIISQTYPSRPIDPADPSPITITDRATGPLLVDPGRVLCDKCGNIIRKSYLPCHRESGACARTAQRKKDNQRNADDAKDPKSESSTFNGGHDNQVT